MSDLSTLKVAICGGGNATHVLAGLLGASSGVEVKIYDILEEECNRLKTELSKHGSSIEVEYSDGRDNIIGQVSKVSNKAADVIPGSDVVILAVPAFAHEKYFKEVAPYVSEGATVGVMVAQGGVDWQFKHIFGEKSKKLTFFAMETLPWACRISHYGRSVEVLGTKKQVDVSITPEAAQIDTLEMLKSLIGVPSIKEDRQDPEALLPKFVLCPNFLSCTMMNINSVWHPCISYGKFYNWDKKTTFKEKPLFYEGVDDFTADTLTEVSNEILAVKSEILRRIPGLNLEKVTHVLDWILRSYAGDMSDTTSLKTCINTNVGYRGLTHAMRLSDEGEGLVPDVSYRYYSEDVPFGLVVTRGIAELAGVPTPTLDKVIQWEEYMCGKEYLKDGKLSGKDIAFTRAPQRYGITTLEGLL